MLPAFEEDDSLFLDVRWLDTRDSVVITKRPIEEFCLVCIPNSGLVAIVAGFVL